MAAHGAKAQGPANASSTAIWVAVSIAVGVGGFVIGNLAAKKSPKTDAQARVIDTGNEKKDSEAKAGDPAQVVYSVPVGDSPFKGPADALVTIVEFSEFECPFCSRVTPTMKKIAETYGNDVRIAFKHNPLPFHKNAMPAAKAAYAAEKQGKFWEYHDVLFANQKQLDEESLKKYAGEVGLDMAKFEADRASGAAEERVKADQTLARGRGANGTPAFFINGRFLSGAQPFERFKAVIDEELGKAKQAVSKGTPRGKIYDMIVASGAKEPAKREQPRDQPQQKEPAAYAAVDAGANTPFKGPADALVTIIEFSDFECPFCSRVVPTIKQITDAYGDKVRIGFRHLPLPFHKNAEPASRAAYAAQKQGKFWEMHDTLFANQKALDRESLVKYAKDLGLNTAQFEKDLDDPATAKHVADDNAYASKVGARGTPHFFVNGRRVSGAQPFESFKTVIDEELKRAEAELPKVGGDKSKLYAHLMANLPKEKPIEIAVGASPTFGPANAAVKIFEFSEFQCPFCSRVVPTVKQIKEAYGDKVQFVWKNRPLPFHNNAKIAAEASMAAHAQGKFWEYHDVLFANQKALERENLIEYAKQVGLDVAKFTADLDGGKYRAQVEADDKLAQQVGAQGTPTFIINGEKFVGAQPFEAFKQKIDEKLAEAGKKG